jgi:hypothetical protein
LTSPILIGGNGHSGTRIFAQLLEHNGIFMGVPRVTRSYYSYDLHVFDLLNHWIEPYVYKRLDPDKLETMQKQFRRRLRLFFPIRQNAWGWKNPRSMLMLPVYHKLFPDLKFIHVIRDGRDITVGNEFAVDNPYANAFLSESEQALPSHERMMLFWGRSNETAMNYCREHLPDTYLFVRWEDLCRNPESVTRRILGFINRDLDKLESTAAMVKLPRSIGRWKKAEPELRDAVNRAGSDYLSKFGYS